MRPLWGIDLGGTKIEGVVVDADQAYQPLARLRVPTEKEQGYGHIIHQTGRLIELLQSETGLSPVHVGLGTPGTLDPVRQTMKNSNATQLLGRHFQRDLEEALQLSFSLANDANCFALAETKMGSVPEQVPGAELVFGVIMGTGVGGGIVINGKARDGLHHIAGEWGHNLLDASGGESYSGLHGNVESILAGPSLERYYASQSGEQRSLKEIVARSRTQEDPFARQTIERLIYFFGKAIANIINILDPDAIVLGGGVGNIEELYSLGPEAAKRFVFNYEPEVDHPLQTPFLKPKLGDSAGVFGAAMLTENVLETNA